MNLNDIVNEKRSKDATEWFEKRTSKDSDHCINVELCLASLRNISSIFDKSGLDYKIIFGTLLGIYRSGTLIPHDTDVDIALRLNDAIEFIPKIIDELIECGFMICRYSPSVLLSLWFGDENGDYIDLYLFRNGEIGGRPQYLCSQWSIPKPYYDIDNVVECDGVMYKTIGSVELFLSAYYGKDWETPIKKLHASKSNRNRGL